MDSLPYELLQHIAGYLLPRHQCRLALVSSWCYKYLYDDLLAWHARKAPIPVPRYASITGFYYPYSIIICDNKVRLVCTHDKNITVDNLTTLISHSVRKNNKIYINVIKIGTFYLTPKFYYKILRIMQCHKYVHRDILITILNSTQPIAQLTSVWKICKYIKRIFNDQDLSIIRQCEHLKSIFAP